MKYNKFNESDGHCIACGVPLPIDKIVAGDDLCEDCEIVGQEITNEDSESDIDNNMQ